MNAYSDIFLYAIMIFFTIMFPLAYLLRNLCKNKFGKIKNFFFWNGFIRLLISSYLQTMLFSMLNLHEMRSGDSQPDRRFKIVQISNVLCIVFFVLCFLIPSGIMLYLRLNRNRLMDQNLLDKIGTFVEGAKHIDPQHVISIIMI